MKEIIIATFVIGLSAMYLTQASAANVQQGEKLARRWCAACHVVSTDQTTATTAAPPFSDIAKRRLDADKLASFLMSPHPVMPDMSLTRDEAAYLAAYIQSQGENGRD